MELEEILSRHPEIANGELCFTGTRVPAQSLIGHMKAGDSLEDFLEGFSGVSRAQDNGIKRIRLQVPYVLPIQHARLHVG